MTRERSISRLQGLLWLGCVLCVPLAWAQDVVLDRIVAVVNEAVVLTSDVDAEIVFLRTQADSNQQRLPDNAVLRERVVERLIDVEIQRQRARQLGVNVDATAINRAIEQVAGNNNMTQAQFRETLRAQGFDYDQFRDSIRQTLLTQRLIQRDVESRIRVSQQEIDDFLAASDSDAREQRRFRISHILVAVEPSAPVAERAEARARIESMQQQLADGEDFATVAAAGSDGARALEGGDLGWRTLQEVPRFLANALRTLDAGAVSEPLDSPNGLHLIKLEAVEETDQSEQQETLVRHIFLSGDAPERSDQLADIRRRLQQGDSFASLAAEFSEDPNSADDGGELPWFTDGEMPQGLEQVAKQLPIGQVSEPFRTQFGWHLLEVLDRRSSEISEANRRERARAALEQRKIEQESERWIRQLRDETYIEMRPV